MKRKVLLTSYFFLLAALFSVLVFSVTAAFYNKRTSNDGSYGEISLRSYYDSGSGLLGDPFIITRPRHLLNFSRLHGLGVYGDPKKPTYFQLGKAGLNPGNPDQRFCYTGDTGNTLSLSLDMVDYPAQIFAIGSETVPFYGEFDGSGLEISNLDVYADPQDAGFFGYTAHGSSVHHLFLNNIAVHTLGYASRYTGLYGTGDSYTADDGVMLRCTKDTGSPAYQDFVIGGAEVMSAQYNATGFFASSDPLATLSGFEPTISLTDIEGTPRPEDFHYKLISYGNFLVENSETECQVNMENVGKFFKLKIAENDPAPVYPLTASASVSVCATQVDGDGVEHSKVVMNIRFAFTIEEEGSNYIQLNVFHGEEHTNNIGLLIGHCDGTVSDCYVRDGSFSMNEGSAGNLENYSSMGLIGLVGDMVKNTASGYSGSASSAAGTDIGVLDFTNIYKNIIGSDSFSEDNSTALAAGGISYAPKGGSKYLKYLRQNNDNPAKYVTRDSNSVSLRGHKVIHNEDLGVFTVATDDSDVNYGSSANSNLSNSTIAKDSIATDSVYYATGEYVKGKNDDAKDIYGNTFASYCASMVTKTPSQMHVGYYLPPAD
ncbi:MAG: hypothetical protein J6O18_03155, partial [Bacilli bacterium]|nr:hypothetical protein [Bacilli bacterium]